MTQPTQRDARIAGNESHFRDINERLRDDLTALQAAPADRFEFVCECGLIDCRETIALTLAEFEAVRRDPHLFAVVPGHEIENVETAVERHEAYWVMRKDEPTHPIVEARDRRTP
jgi:hypothetical protein